jgi:hypothetical protein
MRNYSLRTQVEAALDLHIVNYFGVDATYPSMNQGSLATYAKDMGTLRMVRTEAMLCFDTIATALSPEQKS